MQTIFGIFNKIIVNMAQKPKFYQRSIVVITTSLILAAGILVGLYFGTNAWLRNYTQYGVEIVVPDITGMFPDEAQATLEEVGLHLVVIDSAFSQKTRLGTFLEQTPRAGTKVKYGRDIYAIQNSCIRRPIIMPELRDISLRQAESKIKALGMEVGKITYEPSAYKNLILDMRIFDVPILAGTQVPEGSVIDLIVGKGPDKQDVTVPSIIGKTLTEARSWLIGNSLSFGKIEYDEEPNDETLGLHVVYEQTPREGPVVRGGTPIHIKLTTNLEKVVTTGNIEEEDEIFF